MASFTAPGGGTINPDGTPVDTTTTTNGGTPGVTQDGVGGFLQGIGQTLTGSNNGFTNAALLPAIGSAINEFQNAGRYTDLGNQAANRADPFGQYRQYYGDKLRGLYDDPSSIANTPGYKFALNQAMDSTSSKLASQGYLGSTQMQNALATESSGLAQQTFNQERNALMQMAGSQFDPANAASMQMKGGELSMQARSNALGDLFYPFGPGAGGTTVNNNNNGGKGGGLDRSGLQNSLTAAISSGKISGADAATLFNRILSSQGNISDGDINLLNNLGIQNPVDLGGVDTAPGSYDASGYGGYGDVNSSTGSIIDSNNGSVFNSNNILGAGYNNDMGLAPSYTFQSDPWSP